MRKYLVISNRVNIKLPHEQYANSVTADEMQIKTVLKGNTLDILETYFLKNKIYMCAIILICRKIYNDRFAISCIYSCLNGLCFQGFIKILGQPT